VIPAESTLCLLLVAISTTITAGQQLVPAARAPYAVSMTVVPPGPVSNQVEIEVRIAVRNYTPKPARFEVVVSVESPDGESHPVSGTPLEVAANGQQLTTARFASSRFVGKNQIHCSVSDAEVFRSSHNWPLEVIACETRALPLLQMGWLDPGAVPSTPSEADSKQRAMTETNLRNAIDRYRDVGITGLIITYPEDIYSGGGPYYPSRVFVEHRKQAAFDVVGTILNQASKNGQHVFVGLGRGADLLLTWTGFDDPDRKQAALAHSMKTATELWFLYGHEPSFYGWYLTHEANDIAQASRAYYNPMVDFLRTFEADKPVLISPAGTPILSRDIIAKSKVDVFAYQDAVGSGYIPYENTFDPQRRIKMLEGVYTSYADAHRDSGKHLWANLEIWQMDGPEYGNSYPPKFERVREQLQIAQRHVDVVTTYQLIGFIDPSDSELVVGGQRAIDLFESYRSYHEATVRQLGMNNPDKM